MFTDSLKGYFATTLVLPGGLDEAAAAQDAFLFLVAAGRRQKRRQAQKQ